MRIVLISNLGLDLSPWDIPANEIRMWAYVLCADTRNAQLVLGDLQVAASYDLALIDLTTNLFGLPQMLREAFPGMILVGLVEGWVGNIAAIDVGAQCDFLVACRTLDMLGILAESAASYYRLYTTPSEKVQFLGIPFPKAWTDERPIVPFDEREFAIWMPFALRPVRSGISHVLAVRQLRKHFPDLKAYAVRSSEDEDVHLRAVGADVELISFADWPIYYHRLSRMFAVLNFDHLPTWGRVVGECAAARVPYVGFDATYCAKALGVLTSTPFDVDTSLGYIEQLLRDRRAASAGEGMYSRVVQEQYCHLSAIDEATSCSRFWKALERALSAKRVA
jgi:hypothetical protein